MKPSTTLLAALALPLCDAFSLAGRPVNLVEVDKRAPLQNLVTWDDQSLFIRGERVFMFSGEFHPFRLPVPSLYLDIFQKIRALGFNMVSFYVDWALVEGKPGEFRAQGIFDLEPFFEAAKEAGIYLLARPGPYINAEVSGGGFPGWLQRINGVLRTDAGDFLGKTDNYMANICAIIAKHQITQGGPVVLFQPENEYSYGKDIPFPNGNYMQYVIDQARKAGIVVPMINNDIGPVGYYAPGSGRGAMDIYANPSIWPFYKFHTDRHLLHMMYSPSTPFSLVEFQGGSYDPWGGNGLDQCAALINHEFERVYYKNNIAAGVRIFSLYMIFGGTNWGNLGHPGGYTSYDYGACIRENRVVDREKYSELKLEAEFLRVSPGYLVTTAGNTTKGVYSPNENITVTPLLAQNTASFFVVRHTDFANTGSTAFTLRLPTSAGILTIPQSGGALTLLGRDSKVMVTDYPVGDYSLLYSSAEVFTWKKFAADKTVLVLYGGRPGETHEFAVRGDGQQQVRLLEGDDGVMANLLAGVAVVVKWKTTTGRQVVKIGHLVIHLLDRNSAYKYWVPVLPSNGSSYGSSVMNPESLIINGGYLIRSAAINGPRLSLKADFNTSTPLEIIGVPPGVSQLSVNGQQTRYSVSALGDWIAEPDIGIPKVFVPDLSALPWRRIDSLPEIQPGYDDSAWPVADKQRSSNSAFPSTTPVSLYGSDYGFHTGTLVFRGHFTAKGNEASLYLRTSGGTAFASSVWLDGTFVGSFKNAEVADDNNSTYRLPPLTGNNDVGAHHVLTVVVDNTGLNEVTNSGTETMKAPRGILSYALLSSDGRPSGTEISPWKLTGNLGGEDYVDESRGPLNEGGLFFERQGYHLPGPPGSEFDKGSPMEGLRGAGITFYAAPLTLNYPDKYDIPFTTRTSSSSSSTFSTATKSDYRATLFVNGFQFGKYASNIGPQSEFPVPEGILNYRGTNWIGLAVWALDPSGAAVPTFRLKAGTAVVTGREPVYLVNGTGYSHRPGAY
ncbi:hypothetical protein L249_4730 [Ophiocordyceps polyrhachis-furcata BCC 54312]|uniref:Beta-galactosidase n=1 Tax=Ophiocordyceps polyrhachis-furcata BCC 54312 TaxID=1330021 RepID=A0A367L2G3_9HYPO|nr:hypothetical protein L249_4730 [Ophiocordyceps polyrhachis-furcata BCC 54312]